MRLFVVLSAVAAAVAQLTINTPLGVLACTNNQISWTGGTPPYILQIQPGGDTSAAALETFTNIAASPYTWHVIEPANTQVFLRLHDANGVTAETGTFTIQSAGTTTCSSSSAPGTGSSSSGAVVPPPASSSSTPPAAGSSSTPQAGGSSTTPAGSSSTPSASHSSSTSTTGGASAAHVAGGLFGLVGAVAVALAA